MGHIQSMPFGKFQHFPLGNTLIEMQTVHETRRQRLDILLTRFATIAALNEALGWPRTDSRLSRIKNANARPDREGKVFQIGDSIAREIEATLKLGIGWMDTPPSQAEIDGKPDPVTKALEILSVMEPEAQYQALRLLVRLHNLRTAPTTPKSANDPRWAQTPPHESLLAIQELVDLGANDKHQANEEPHPHTRGSLTAADDTRYQEPGPDELGSSRRPNS